jgi:hypothetical protein
MSAFNIPNYHASDKCIVKLDFALIVDSAKQQLIKKRLQAGDIGFVPLGLHPLDPSFREYYYETMVL